MELTPRMVVPVAAVAVVLTGVAAGWLTSHFASPPPQRSEIENIVRNYLAAHPQLPPDVSQQRPEIEKFQVSNGTWDFRCCLRPRCFFGWQIHAWMKGPDAADAFVQLTTTTLGLASNERPCEQMIKANQFYR